jgi:hypothetical protein
MAIFYSTDSSHRQSVPIIYISYARHVDYSFLRLTISVHEPFHLSYTPTDTLLAYLHYYLITTARFLPLVITDLFLYRITCMTV